MGERVLGYLVVLVAFAGPLVGLFAPLGLAPLAGLAMLVAVAATWRDKLWRTLPRFPVALVSLVAAWGVVGALWAVDPGQTLKTSLRFLVMSLAGLWLVSVGARACEGRRHAVLAALASGLAVCGALLAWEYLAQRGMSQFLADLRGTPLIGAKSPLNRGATVFALLLWPLALMVARRFGAPAAVGVAVAGTAVVLLGDSGSGKLAGLVALLLLASAWVLPRATFTAVRAGFAALVVALPVVAAHLPPPQQSFEEWRWLPLSAHHRLTIWTFTGARIAEKPVLGWAMDASRTIPGAEEEIRVTRSPGPGEARGASILETMLPLHPHNAILQWWLELGLPGAALLGAFFWWLIGRAGALPLPAFERATFLAMFGTGLVVSLNSYGFWQAWWQGGLWLAALLWTLAMRRPGPEN